MAGKLKTNKSARKRFRVTKHGKFVKSRAGKRHLQQGKSSKRKRQLRKSDLVNSKLSQSLRRLMPYA